MPKNADWLPTTRTNQLAMARNWRDILQNSGTAWKIPKEIAEDIGNAANEAETALAAAKNESTRTPVATAKCKEAFMALTAIMRDVKKRCFYVPPLADSDLISLGLKPHDTIPTPGGAPAAQATVETYLAGRHELGVKIIYVTGNPNDTANKGFRIWYSVTAQGETPPANPGDLKKSFYTKRKKDLIEFEFGGSGKTAHFAVQIEIYFLYFFKIPLYLI